LIDSRKLNVDAAPGLRRWASLMDDPESEHCKEVYARFGLAMYEAQVLEHGIVNALVIVDLIPERRPLARSRTEWENDFDEFMGRQFKHTMGRLLRYLGSITKPPPDLGDLLTRALEKRNWLAHEFFRERATEFVTSKGRDQMLTEVDECAALFRSADEALVNVMQPLRTKQGITNEMLEKSLQAMLDQSNA